MWKAQEKLPKSASHPGAGKSPIPRPLPWQNWEGDPGVRALHPPRLPIPSTMLKGAFVQLQAPQVGGRFIHTHPCFTPRLGCFFPGAAVSPSLCDAGLRVASATGAWGCGWGSTPSWDPFGMFAWGLVIPLAADLHVPSKTHGRAFCWVCAGLRQAWWKCKIGVCRAGARVAQGVGSGRKYLASRFHPRDAPLQLLSIAQPGYYCPAITAGTINY